MPSIKERKGKKGSGFLAEVRLKGFPPLAKTFKRKSEAKYWAMQVESDLRSDRNLKFYQKNHKTLSDAISRYIRIKIKYNYLIKKLYNQISNQAM